MDDYHFNNIAKIIVPYHIGENKNLQFYKKMDIFYVLKIKL
jgi:hypothetical protein